MTLIVAEIGINHGSSLETAKDLIRMAHRCGVPVVKFQKRTPELCVPRNEWQKDKQTPWGTIEPYIEYRRKMEFDYDQYREIDSLCKSLGMQWTASVWDVPSLEFITRFDVPFIKIPSALLTNHNLINMTIDTDRPIVLSTGMSTIDEIDDAVKLFPSEYDATLLHCDSTYPSPDDQTNLRCIESLRYRYGLSVGYSLHNKSPYPAIYSVFYGATMIECHISLDRASKGSDHMASLEEGGLHLLVREVNRIPTLIGDGIKRVYDSELSARTKLRGA
jgi:N-acetylneuraminate synthase